MSYHFVGLFFTLHAPCLHLYVLLDSACRTSASTGKSHRVCVYVCIPSTSATTCPACPVWLHPPQLLSTIHHSTPHQYDCYTSSQTGKTQRASPPCIVAADNAFDSGCPLGLAWLIPLVTEHLYACVQAYIIKEGGMILNDTYAIQYLLV